MSENTRSRVDGKFLLNKLLELKRRLPQEKNWDIGRLSQNTGNFIRLRQVEACAEALDLDFDVRDFFNTRFTDTMDNELARARIEALQNTYKQGELSADLLQIDLDKDANSVLFGFSRCLIDYRLKADEVYNCFSGLMEAPKGFMETYELVKERIEKFRKTNAFIDDLLGIVIHPYADFKILQTVKDDFGYPDEDPDGIDLDNF